MKEYHWWILSAVMATLIAATEVYVCGWHDHVYECRLISDPPQETPLDEFELPDESQEISPYIEQRLMSIP